MDPDFWIKDCRTHYEYLAAYIDNVIAFRRDPGATIKELRKDYKLKGIGKPIYYLGGDIKELGGDWRKHRHTALSAQTYITNVIWKFEQTFGELREYKTPMETNYHPKLDTSLLLEAQSMSLYWALIGSVNWLITLSSQFDIHYATNAMACFAIAPCKGHMEARHAACIWIL